MRRLLVLAAVLAASALAVGTASAPARSLNTKCVPDKKAGVEIVNHVALIVYCGHAKLTLREGTKVTHYTNGMCLTAGGTFVAGFGKYTSVMHPIAISNSLVLEAPANRDGTYRLGLLTVQKKGQKVIVADKVKVVIRGKRSRGTFSGKFQNGPKTKFTGSFTCK
jgi:hypothetical protein